MGPPAKGGRVSEKEEDEGDGRRRDLHRRTLALLAQVSLLLDDLGSLVHDRVQQGEDGVHTTDNGAHLLKEGAAKRNTAKQHHATTNAAAADKEQSRSSNHTNKLEDA
jgi:hypothetical protein